MLPEDLKECSQKDHPMKSITISFSVDEVESMKKIARLKGFSGYKILLKSYISEGLHRDEERYSGISNALLIEALKKYGVPDTIIQQATRDVIESTTYIQN